MTNKLSELKDIKVIFCESELDLLEQLLKIFKQFNPDIIVGYDTEFQLDVLLSKIWTLRVKDWSRIGKLKRYVSPNFKVGNS